MNTEELTIVMDTLRELGGDGKAAFVWWLVFDKLVPAIAWIVAVCILVFGLARPLTALCTSESYLRSLRDRLGIGCPGYVSADELRELQQRVDKLMGGTCA